MKIFNITLFLICFFSYLKGYSQEDSVILDLKIIDTNLYNGKLIAVYNDQSWDYLNNIKIIEKLNVRKESDSIFRYTDKEIFKNFKTTITAQKTINLKNMLDTVYLKIDSMYLPTQKEISSEFKMRWGRWHTGIDFKTSIGTQIISSWDGIIRYAKHNEGGYGNLVIIRHFNGLETYYAHLSRIDVKINQRVKGGQVIGLSGNSGHSTGPHLHYEIRFFDNPINPMYIIKNLSKKVILINNEIFISEKQTKEKFVLQELLGIVITDKTKEMIESEKGVLRNKKRRNTSNL